MALRLASPTWCLAPYVLSVDPEITTQGICSDQDFRVKPFNTKIFASISLIVAHKYSCLGHRITGLAVMEVRAGGLIAVTVN